MAISGNELTAVLGIELDPKAEQKITKQLDSILGSGKTADPAAQTPMKRHLEEAERLEEITRGVSSIYQDMTKALREQVALRSRELEILKAQAATGAVVGGPAASNAAAIAAATAAGAAAGAAAVAASGGMPPGSGGAPPGGGGAMGNGPGAGGGGGGGSQRGWFAGWNTLLGGNRTQLNHREQRSLVFAEKLGDLGKTAGSLTNQWFNLANRGWGGSELAGTIGDTIDRIPVAGRILGGYTSALDSIRNAGELQDRWRSTAFQIWRNAGERSRASFQNDWFGPGGGVNGMLRYGLTREDTAQLTMAAAKAYGGTPSVEYAVEGRYGLGNEFIGMRGALRRSGHSASNGGEQEFAEAIGIALSTNLERGRWGEVITNLTRVAASVSHGQADFRSQVAIETLIGQLGKQYQGQTPQADAMRTALGQISTGAGGGLGEVLATRQALAASGGDYAAARMMVEAGMGSDRGMSDTQLKELIRNAPIAREFFAGRMDAKRAAYMLHATTWSNIPINRLYDLLVGMAAGAGQRIGPTNEAILSDTYNGARPEIDQLPINKVIGGERPHVRTIGGIGFDAQGPVKAIEDGAGNIPITKPNQLIDVPAALQLQPTQSFLSPSTASAPVFGATGGSIPPAAVDAALWQHLGADVRTGATASQRAGYAARAQFGATKPSDFFVDSWEEAEGQWATKTAHGLYDDRDHDAQGKSLPFGQHRRHGSRDIFMPPGSPVRAPMDGEWVRSGDLNSQMPTYGFYGEMRGSDGILYRFLHLDKRPNLTAGESIRAGQLIGYTATHKVGRSKSHLHLEAWEGNYKTGTKVDPFQKMGLRGINMMYTGAGSREEWSAPASGSSGSAPVTSPSAVDTGQSHQRVDVNVTVHDGRISVSKRITPGSIGQVGQNYTRMG